MPDAMPSRIVLVGNARSLLTRDGLGNTIDAFPIVIRFNNFVTAGYEGHVGSKTDWWARNETDEVERRPGPFEKIILRLQGEQEATYSAGEALLPQLRLQHPGTPIDIIPRRIFTDLIEAYHFRNAPLTGTLVIAHLLREYERVCICGFDNLVGTPETLRHYYSEGNVIGDWTTFHEPDKEAVYLTELIRQGRVVPI
ncbi:MAG: glycosyltransferase family 29 protein [Akkermansiaceae bacterium]|nr:glycosyltransferase family 29 protein [Armatimonadota bacterium]